MKSESEQLEKLYSEVQTQTTLYGLKHHGNEIHKKLEEALKAIRDEHKRLNPDKENESNDKN